MYETNVTLVGTVVTRLDRRRLDNGTPVVSFRVACTERRYDRASEAWVDGGKLYATVTCWRKLAENVHASFVAGDPIIVHGRLHTREFEKDGQLRSVTEVEATAVGPDLTRCTAALTRTTHAAAAATSSAPADRGSQDPRPGGDGDRPGGRPVPGVREGEALVEVGVGA
jgi:single-strand DNA-binding protein